VDVSVDGSDEDEEWTVYAYANSETVARRTLDRLPVLLSNHGATFLKSRLERWNHAHEEWEDPSLPLPPPRPEPEPVFVDAGDPRWEVKVRSPSGSALAGVREGLEADGHYCVSTGWHRLSVLAYEPDEAGEIADLIRSELPLGSAVETHALSGRRLWLLRDVLGSEADVRE
jgi:hypothetical protein